MKISYLKINYKNLRDVEINFHDSTQISAFIGNNGSGKSNILEALATIFASVYSKPDDCDGLTYKIAYSIDDNEYTIENSDGFSFTKNGKALPKKDYLNALPTNLFLYYCGETDRLRQIAMSFSDEIFEKKLKASEQQIKFISFLSLQDLGLALTSLLSGASSTFLNRIKDILNIQAIEAPITLHLIKPNTWSPKLKITNDSFWGAHGTVAKLLHSFKDVGNMEIINNLNATITITDMAKLAEVSESPSDMFNKLKLLRQVGILSKVEINITKQDISIGLDFLSEGEKQLALLLSILEITKEHKILFLLDEFDAYLHPNWQRQFVEMVSKISIRGQILLTTHSPLTLGKMNKENIFIIKDGEVTSPSADTYNRDITEVLEEVMDVGKRPNDVADLISKFKQAAALLDKTQAQQYLDELKYLLKDNDPFFVTAAHSMSVLEFKLGL